MSKNVVEADRPHMTLPRMRIACWITKATNTYSENVILIALPMQQWLHDAPQCYVTCTLPVLLTLA
jgi:hypothetical protein